MNKNLVSFILLVLLISNTIVAQEVTEAHKDSINTVLNNYYNLNLKMFQADSTVEDIDNAFNLFTDDFTYTHAKFNGFHTRKS